jgi:hypothetical protein
MAKFSFICEGSMRKHVEEQPRLVFGVYIAWFITLQ